MLLLLLRLCNLLYYKRSIYFLSIYPTIKYFCIEGNKLYYYDKCKLSSKLSNTEIIISIDILLQRIKTKTLPVDYHFHKNDYCPKFLPVIYGTNYVKIGCAVFNVNVIKYYLSLLTQKNNITNV